jgi:4-amino-4-deoxy-L-arabinose transferase-like glycosyltransferase
VTGWPFVLAVALPTAAALLVWRTRIPRSYAILLLGCLVVAPTSFVLIASSDHVAANLYNPRYAIPVLLTLLATAGAGALLTLRGLIPSPPRRNAAFAATVAVLLLAAWARLSATPVSHTEFIELGKADVAQTIAYRYVALRLDGIAGDYWIVWPAVFETEQLHHDMAWQGADVLGISHRSKARRDTFIARLDTQRQLRVACIDMAPDDCAYWTMRATGVAGLRGQPFATPETIDGDHRLYYVTILPPS